MQDVKVTLSIMWIAVMLTYLLGDVLRIFTGDVTLGEIQGVKIYTGHGIGYRSIDGHSDPDGCLVANAPS